MDKNSAAKLIRETFQNTRVRVKMLKQVKVKEYEYRVNETVYKLYGFTAEEIRIVEKIDKK